MLLVVFLKQRKDSELRAFDGFTQADQICVFLPRVFFGGGLGAFRVQGVRPFRIWGWGLLGLGFRAF